MKSADPRSGTPVSLAAFARDFTALRNRVSRAVESFAHGGLVLVGDDGRRENEADLVFHASHATPAAVNFSLLYGRGLLCVSVSEEIADRLAFMSAPKMPGAISHTGFTLSVDARDNISSGISAADRSVTIKLMANPQSQPKDFISPGHVFPIRAQNGGLLARAGHTEAVLELCRLAELPAAAAMCEVLADDGEALRPDAFLRSPEIENTQLTELRKLPYISTVDLLWHRIFYEKSRKLAWEEVSGFCTPAEERVATTAFRFACELQKPVTLSTLVLIYKKSPDLSKLRIVLSNGAHQWDNGIARSEASAEVVLSDFSDLLRPVCGPIAEFCDLSAKEGLNNTQVAVRRVVSELRAVELLRSQFEIDAPISQSLAEVKFVCADDAELLKAIHTL